MEKPREKIKEVGLRSQRPFYSLGLDFGTSSVRALFVSLEDGRELGGALAPFLHGTDGVITDPGNPHLARQHPADYETALVEAVRAAISQATGEAEFDAERVVGIGVDATASTPVPLDARCRPLATIGSFEADPNAMAWLWKDHTSHAEAEEISHLARQLAPSHLSRCGGAYSSEWLYAKLLRCARVAPEVLEHSSGWVELGDYVTGFLVGCDAPQRLTRNVCAAGHKAMYHDELGLPPAELFRQLDPRLAAWRERNDHARFGRVGERAGLLSQSWAEKLGLRPGIPVSVAAVDAHLGAVGAGIRPGVLVKILGTSACDMLVHPASDGAPADIPGLCGMVLDSIVPGYWGLEAGQPATGDIFGWFVREFGEAAGYTHLSLTQQARELRPGESGLLALDWNNGNRSVLADPLLTGCLVGQTLGTRPPEVYRALIEATAFGARVIVDRLSEYGVAVDEIVLCGGIAEKNPLLLQIYTDVINRPLRISRSEQTCALGAAICGAVAAGPGEEGEVVRGYACLEEAQARMTGLKDAVYRPEPAAVSLYNEIYELYCALHDAFGVPGRSADLHPVMKRLLEIQSRQRP